MPEHRTSVAALPVKVEEEAEEAKLKVHCTHVIPGKQDKKAGPNFVFRPLKTVRF